MINTKESEISTLAALNVRHLNSLHKYGVTERAIELLPKISTDWVKGIGVAAAEFRRDHRKDDVLLRWLEERRFIATERQSPYVPEFKALCAILVARKRVAVSLFGEMKLIVRRALELQHRDPLRTQGGCKKFCVNGLLAGNCRLAWSNDDRREETVTHRTHRRAAGELQEA